MTPKQKQARKDALEMIKFLGIKGDYTKMSLAHMRTAIERRKKEVLDTLGVELPNGLEQTKTV